MQQAGELLVLFKTTDERYELVESTIRELHPYELPAIHAFAFEHVYPAYAEWIAENAGGGKSLPERATPVALMGCVIHKRRATGLPRSRQ